MHIPKRTDFLEIFPLEGFPKNVKFTWSNLSEKSGQKSGKKREKNRKKV